MKKVLIVFFISCGLLGASLLAFADDMKVQSLSVGGETDEESAVQTILKHEIEPVDNPPQVVPVEVNNYIDVNPYPYYNPYTPGVYTRVIGPYGVYTNVGGLGVSYQSYNFGFGVGRHSPIWVGPPPKPPGGNMHPPGGHRPPPNGAKPPHNGAGHHPPK